MERHTTAILLGAKYTSYAARAATRSGSVVQTHRASVLEVRHLKEDEQGHVLSEGSWRGVFFACVQFLVMSDALGVWWLGDRLL